MVAARHNNAAEGQAQANEGQHEARDGAPDGTESQGRAGRSNARLSVAPRNVILQGDALAVLRTLPDGCVQTCVTSPPYWGLRAYGTAPQVWDGDEGCDHRWVSDRYYREGGNSGGSSLAFSQPGPANAARIKETRWRDDTHCQRCNAWRGELGQEPTPERFIAHLVAVFREVMRVLRDDGTLWVNIGDSFCTRSVQRDDGLRSVIKNYAGAAELPTWSEYAARGRARYSSTLADGGLKDKDLVGIPWMLAFALRADGWYLRSDIVWAKVACMPESVQDRPTRSHEYLFLFAKQSRYYYDRTAIQEPVAPSSIARVSQPTFATQHGGPNDYAATGVNANRSMRKAVEAFAARARADKQGDLGKRTYTGFNDRRDALDPAEQEAIGRNKRDVWFLSPEQFPAAHFATMPQALVSPCILAGSSHKACETCGAPWRRVERREREKDPTVGHNALRGAGHMRESAGGPANREGREFLRVVAAQTTGWVPTCACNPAANTGASRSLVLDPFAGAGTVPLVAKLTGRDYLGIELNESYCDLARRRIALFGRLGRGQPPPKAGEQGPPSLWAGVDLDGEGDGEGVTVRDEGVR